MKDTSFVRPGAGLAQDERESRARRSSSWRMWLLGRPLPTADAPHEAIGKTVGLAVFSSDALSSTAYATQEMLMVLAFAGSAAFSLVFPISIAIVLLLALVTISYEQTIHAYPGGGGAYIVARDNLGELAAQVAGGALLMDYILTVAVSMSSGVAQLVSAFPALFPFRVAIAVVLVGCVMLINLRGVRESGTVVAVPTFFFIAVMYATVGTALFRHFAGSLGAVVDPPPLHADAHVGAVTLFLLLHAFSSGTTALTGVEAISNGIPAFKEPRSRNAGITLLWMAGILGSLFLGDQLPGGADRGGAVRDRDRDLAARAHRVRRTRRPLPGDDRRHGAHPGDGRQHRLRGLPAPGGAAGPGRLPAAPAHLPRQPARLLARDRAAGASSPRR